MSRTTLALAGLILLGAAGLAAWNVPQAVDPDRMSSFETLTLLEGKRNAG